MTSWALKLIGAALLCTSCAKRETVNGVVMDGSDDYSSIVESFKVDLPSAAEYLNKYVDAHPRTSGLRPFFLGVLYHRGYAFGFAQGGVPDYFVVLSQCYVVSGDDGSVSELDGTEIVTLPRGYPIPQSDLRRRRTRWWSR